MPNSTPRKGGCGSIARNNHTYLWPRVARARRIRKLPDRLESQAFGSSRILIASFRAWTTGRPTIVRRSDPRAERGSVVAIRIFAISGASAYRWSIRRTTRASGWSSICAASAAWSKRNGRYRTMLDRQCRRRCCLPSTTMCETIFAAVARSDELRPTLIAIVGYEDPSTLQLVLEAGAVAVIERPIRPFGLLTNLTIARSIWLRAARDGKTASQARTQALRHPAISRKPKPS